MSRFVLHSDAKLVFYFEMRKKFMISFSFRIKYYFCGDFRDYSPKSGMNSVDSESHGNELMMNLI